MTEPNCSAPFPGPTASVPASVDEGQQLAAYYIWLRKGKRRDDPNTALWWLVGGLQLELLAEEATGTVGEIPGLPLGVEE